MRLRRVLLHGRSWLGKTKARITNNCVAAGYFNANNFGDLLTPDVLESYGIKSIHCPVFRYTDCVGAGSILHLLNSDYRGAILGSGFIRESDGKKFPHARVQLVRGELTRKLIGAASAGLGDPGLIAKTLYPINSNQRRTGLGVVPHFTDFNHPLMQHLSTFARVIDVRNRPQYVAQEIASCEAIISSSLHGLIIADAYGIPSRQIILGNKLVGGDFKFRDYYSCFDRTPNPLTISGSETLDSIITTTQTVDQLRLVDLQKQITQVYQNFTQQHLKRD